ncbi:hypothetical protein PGB90_005328 [Kerria lacca]
MSVLEFEGTTYSPFIPMFPGLHPLYTHFSNLRTTVEALAAPAFQLAAKIIYYINNPIPGAVWNEDPANLTLQNADQIIPAQYDLNMFNADIAAINNLLDTLQKCKICPKLFAKTLLFDGKGTEAKLVTSRCNKSVVRCVTFGPNDHRVEGIREDFFSSTAKISALRAQTGAEFL